MDILCSVNRTHESGILAKQIADIDFRSMHGLENTFDSLSSRLMALFTFPDELDSDATNASVSFPKKGPPKKETGLEHEKFSRCLLTFDVFIIILNHSIHSVHFVMPVEVPTKVSESEICAGPRKKEWGSGDEKLGKNGSPGIVRPGPMIRHPVKVTHCLIVCYLFKSWDLARNTSWNPGYKNPPT